MIQDYQNRIQVSANSGIVMDQETGVGQALQQTGSNLFQQGNEYMKGLIRETAEADLAKSRMDTATAWNEWQNSAKDLQDPEEIAESFRSFENEQSYRVRTAKSNRLGKRAIELDASETMIQMRQKALGVGGLLDKAIIQKDGAIWQEQMENALMGSYDEKTYQSDQEAYLYALNKQVGLGIVSKIDAATMAANYEADRNYHLANGRLAALNESYKNGFIATNEEYINRLQVLRGNIAEMKMKSNQSSYLDSTITQQMGNAAYKDRSMKQQELASIMEKSANGTLKVGSAIEFFRSFPQELQDLALAAEQGAMTYASAAENTAEERKAANKALKAEELFTNGKMSPYKALTAISNSGSKIAPAAMLMLASALYDKSNGADDMFIYECGLRMNKNIKVRINPDSFLAKVTARTAEYVALMGSDAKFIEQAFEDAMKWQTKNTNATPEEMKVQLDKMFAGKAGLMIRESTRKSYAPETDEELINSRTWAE